ncbi:MAG: hypothetical protein LGR52_05380 [Candidatus Thiosymbion ectosymbiont of Robbea hypermnestra]|nr:hypothetical protein [Candidatus Thiosymbion ectosymbiont of Robbea hypermnestra]
MARLFSRRNPSPSKMMGFGAVKIVDIPKARWRASTHPTPLAPGNHFLPQMNANERKSLLNPQITPILAD